MGKPKAEEPKEVEGTKKPADSGQEYVDTLNKGVLKREEKEKGGKPEKSE